MAQRVLIDGYNLIAELWGMGSGSKEIARQRAELLRLLSSSRRGSAVEVVFDGWREGDPYGGGSREAGIDVTFSPRGVTADEVIGTKVRERGPGTLVVTSDRGVAREARAAGADVADAATYARRLAVRPGPRREVPPEGARDEDSSGWQGHTAKKGNPKKAKKRDRALRRRLEKL
jgi:predicted RNA-binding protein with PIN domain